MSQNESSAPATEAAECIMVKDDKPWTPTRRAKKSQNRASTRSPSVMRTTPDNTNPAPTRLSAVDLPSNAPSPVAAATPNRVKRQGMFVERLNAVWGERKWFPPEQFLSGSHNKPLREGAVSLGPGHVSNLMAITNMALELGLDPKGMYEPGGVLYEAMINSKGVPVWSSKTTIKAHELLQARCRAKGIALPGTQTGDGQVPDVQPCEKDAGESSQPGSDQEMGPTSGQMDGSSQADGRLASIEEDREPANSAAQNGPVPSPGQTAQNVPVPPPVQTASQSTDTNGSPHLAREPSPPAPTADQLHYMKHWTEQLILATQYFAKHPPVPPRQLLSSFERARVVSDRLENKNSATHTASQACREKMDAAKAHLARKEAEYREALALLSKLGQLSTPAAQLEGVKAERALAGVLEEKRAIDKKIADLKVQEEMTCAGTGGCLGSFGLRDSRRLLSRG
ncbi:hypothetical protein CONLIGDRAFT_141711 [Coniochaeta ligniaria NRRL 30616]|uniref:Uncharacterized protein n=1 Tax=Coniochaeta ligniaria NRRL 30616 TaxID=1408157 RepID=A0A1J7I788_9PEZI|nr:hypothetical protein CONLIGDRAFT_141711 [Coniochaeta ligniaria NRRL 30616]